MEKNLPPKLDSETLRQLATEQLVGIIMEQALAIEALKTRVIELEIVEYQRYSCICSQCGETQTADWSPEIVPGQDIGIRLQAL
ncbi:hypothetical protein [Anabaena azotica]|uniref:hypothetical protein n=1 Tax=Anabaena azotica TaxID=197653 RepID=UPI0039A53648